MENFASTDSLSSIPKEIFKRVLVAIDGSDVSMRAADHAARIARHDGAKLFELSVIPAPSFKIPEEEAVYFEDARKVADKWMREVESIASSHDMTLATEIIVGASNTLDALLGYAQNISVDLIVTGRRGKASSPRRLLGSVSSGVVEYADCAVLVIK